MARRRTVLAVAAPLVILLGLPTNSAGASDLSYSIREARAYSFRVPLRKEVIEAARRARPCDPETDPYKCDTTQYEHKPNCPSSVAYGPRSSVPEPTEDSADQAATGGAGDSAGAGTAPPEGGAIALNDLLALGRLGRAGDIVDAAGLASDSYVDLSGRQNALAHAESDAVSPNANTYEERCDPVDGDQVPASHDHLLSRSDTGPETYHLAQCFGRECTFGGGLAIGATAEQGLSIVHLSEQGGRLVARVKAIVKDASWGDGQFTVDQLETVITLVSDGTASGLEWAVSSTAQGAEMDGRPVSLPPGRVVGGEELQVGMAAPHVETTEDGTIEILAPGLFVASEEQAAYFAGAQLDGSVGGGLNVFSAGGGPDTEVADVSGAAAPPATGGAPAPAAPDTGPAGTGGESGPSSLVSVTRVATGTWPMVLTLGLGFLALLVVLMRWMGRFPWARGMYRVQPFRALDWIYRAFVKT